MAISRFIITILLVALPFTSCTDQEITAPPPELAEPFSVSASRYSLAHYFVDTSYIHLFEPYYQNYPPVLLDPATRVVEAEVWVQRHGATVGPDDRLAVAWMNLPPRPTAGYDSSFRTAIHQSGWIELARFYPLAASSFQLLADGYVGVLSLALDTIPDLTFAVSYKRADGLRFGDFLRDGFADTTSTVMVLKLFKPRGLFSAGPLYAPAWRMLLKNIYSLGPHHISRHGFALDVFRTPPGGSVTNALYGFPLMRVLGIDRFTVDGVPAPQGDGIFDFLPNITVRQPYGEIILPSLRPFDTGMRAFFMNQNIPVSDSTIFYRLLYDTTRPAAELSHIHHYTVSGKAIFD